MHLTVGERQIGQLLTFLALLAKWNRVYNLTAIRDVQQMVTHHLLDSLAVLPHLSDGPVLDVGAGAGLPGIPLAIMRPSQEFVLLDSNAKKTRFMQQAVIDLGLHNVVVLSQRVESLSAQKKYATVISRAFASLTDMLAVAGHLCAPSGAILAMKGGYPEAELLALPLGYALRSVIPLAIPGLEAQRHLVHIVAA